MVPPQVSSVARKPLSIAFEEIAADKIHWKQPAEPDGEETAVDAEAGSDSALLSAVDAGSDPS